MEKESQEKKHPKDQHKKQSGDRYQDAAESAVAVIFCLKGRAGAARAKLFRIEVGLLTFRTEFKFHQHPAYQKIAL
jgi:hypothetical protein